jgi:hypothetical protein
VPIVGIDVQRVDPLRNEVADVLVQKFQQTNAGTKQQNAFEQFQEADQPDPAVFSHCVTTIPDDGLDTLNLSRSD